MENWPICTSHGVVRADILIERKDGMVNFSLKVKQGGIIPKLVVELLDKNKTTLKHQDNVSEFSFKSPCNISESKSYLLLGADKNCNYKGTQAIRTEYEFF
jgi:hypothetical protein